MNSSKLCADMLEIADSEEAVGFAGIADYLRTAVERIAELEAALVPFAAEAQRRRFHFGTEAAHGAIHTVYGLSVGDLYRAETTLGAHPVQAKSDG